MSVWNDVVGQPDVVAVLSSAVASAQERLGGGTGAAMTHAWLLTGPPGSGRSNAARAFAAALQCESGGCGECQLCRTSLVGSHPDVELFSTETLSIGVDRTRELVLHAARHPAMRRWQVIVVEDADRLSEPAANALLKAIEEPAARTVWVLCAPALEDVLPTIRSRCRHVHLRTPSAPAVAEVLVRRDGVDPAMAAFAARAAQGHIGRARRLSLDEDARMRRADVLRLPFAVGGVSEAVIAAGDLLEAANEEAAAITEPLDAAEMAEMGRALGEGTTGRAMSGQSRAALKDLERQQKQRATRVKRDVLDRSLTDLAALYRDVLSLQLGDAVVLVNEEMRPQLQQLARASTPEQTLGRIEAILRAREALLANVSPQLALEDMALALRARWA
ncbi:MAG: DNA polymerase III subunit delta' [Actinomycetales bacterium]